MSNILIFLADASTVFFLLVKLTPWCDGYRQNHFILCLEVLFHGKWNYGKWHLSDKCQRLQHASVAAGLWCKTWAHAEALYTLKSESVVRKRVDCTLLVRKRRSQERPRTHFRNHVFDLALEGFGVLPPELELVAVERMERAFIRFWVSR